MASVIGSIRRSQVITTFGPGAIVDFRFSPKGPPLSGVVAGLEEWDRVTEPGWQGVAHPQAINEPRLQRKLGVAGFRQPPVREKDPPPARESIDLLPVVRFPDWLQCPRCSRLERSRSWGQQSGSPELWCTACSSDDTKVWVVPVRFVTACEDGHLDEFPWAWWIGCRCEIPKLQLEMEGPGLAGKFLVCRANGCAGARRSLDGVFSKAALRNMACRGREPWLASPAPVPCDKKSQVLQRGASNVYWSTTDSSLDIPPFSADLSDVFGRYWADLEPADPADWAVLLKGLKLDQKTGRPIPVLIGVLADWKRALDSASAGDDPILRPEYEQFCRAMTGAIDKGEFQAKPGVVPPELGSIVSGVVLATRLREVRALTGLTRIHPPSGIFRQSNQKCGRISLAPLGWLPGIALRGEGIFLRISSVALTEWEARPCVRERLEAFVARLTASLDPGETWRRWPSARFLLLHSLSHALMRRLALECGYSSSALRERLYVADGDASMEGILIHTDSPDSEGTLGGLVRQGAESRLVETFFGALESSAWCSQDPVCIQGTMTISSPRNGAACHACLLAPETSCQHFNDLLDRALLIGTPDEPRLGFFRELLDEYAP